MTHCRKGSTVCVDGAEVSNHIYSKSSFCTSRGREYDFWEAAFGHNGRPDALRGSLWCHFGVIGGHFGATLESLWSSLGPLYIYECDYKIPLRYFQIILIFQYILIAL